MVFAKHVADRFWVKVVILGPNDCWPWHRPGKTYPRFVTPEGMKGGHVVAWMLSRRRKVPDGKCVRHRCDNTRCCNPRHVILGTKKQNTADMVRRGRWKKPPTLRGDAHASTKLSEADVAKIRDSAPPYDALAAEYGLSRGHLRKIAKGSRREQG